MANLRREDGRITFKDPKLKIVTADRSADIDHLAHHPPHHKVRPDDILTVQRQGTNPGTRNGGITTIMNVVKAVVIAAADLENIPKQKKLPTYVNIGHRQLILQQTSSHKQKMLANGIYKRLKTSPCFQRGVLKSLPVPLRLYAVVDA